MNISIKPLKINDLPKLKQWYLDIQGERYTSRYMPKHFDGIHTIKKEEYVWYMITADEKDCGIIFLEKDKITDDAIILGIMIGRNECMGKGIGKKAICSAIAQAREIFSFSKVCLTVRKTNIRAITCYTNIGFSVTGEGKKIISTGQETEIFKMVLCIS